MWSCVVTPKSERARGPKGKFRVQNTYLLFGPGELATTSSYGDNAREDVLLENYRSLPCSVIDSQSMTRECHADCNTFTISQSSGEPSPTDLSIHSRGSSASAGSGQGAQHYLLNARAFSPLILSSSRINWFALWLRDNVHNKNDEVNNDFAHITHTCCLLSAKMVTYTQGGDTKDLIRIKFFLRSLRGATHWVMHWQQQM